MKVVVLAIIKLVIIVLLGFFLYRKNIFNRQALEFLTFFLINISVPSLIFVQLIENLDPHNRTVLLTFLAISFILFFVGVGTALLFLKGVPENLKKEFLSLVSFQNCGYLPMNIALFLLPSFLKDEFLVYIFLYILGFNILMWSLGSFFIFRKKGDKLNWRSVINLPTLSIILALIFVYMGIKKDIPFFVISLLKMLGNTSFVFSMIVLGAWLAQGMLVDYRKNKIWKELQILFKVVTLRLFLIPLFVLIGIVKFKIFSLLGLFIMIETCMPSAASLPIVVEWRKGDAQFVSRGVFLTHIIGIFSIPFWLSVFFKISNYSF